MSPTLIYVVVRAAGQEFGVSPDEVLSRRRIGRFVAARQVSYYLLRTAARKTTTEIGKAFGRDHSTVVEGCQTIDAWCETDKTFAARVAKVEARVKGILGPKLES